MNEYVLYQPCITSWSIVLFHPTNLSFSQRLINYGRDSVSNYDLIANQSTPRRGRALLTVCCRAHTWKTHSHLHTEATVSAVSKHFFLVSGIMGKFFSHSNGFPLGTAVSVGWLVHHQHAGAEWNVSVQLLDGSPLHLVRTIMVQSGLARGCVV